MRNIHLTSSDKVVHSARSCNHNLATFFQLSDLHLYARTSINRNNRTTRQILGILFQVICNLNAQFASRTNDKSFYILVVQVNLLNEWQAERRRFSGTCLSQGNQIAFVFQQKRQSLGLHGHHVLKSQILNSPQQLRDQTNIFKTHIYIVLRCKDTTFRPTYNNLKAETAARRVALRLNIKYIL